MPEIIVGMADCLRNLSQMELIVRQEALKEAAMAGGQIVLDSAKATVLAQSTDSGALANGLAKRVAGRESDANEVTVQVGYDRRQFYGRFVEKGTKFMAAEPFLGPALENNKDRIIRVMKEIVLRAVERAVR